MDANALPTEADMALAFMSMLPHSLQCRLVSSTANIWCSIDEEFVVGKSSDALLKHGVLLQGEWNILGILDAFPDGSDLEATEMEETLSQIAGNAVSQLMVKLSSPSRKLLGRPPETWGITPLLIFREIAG